MILNSFSGRIFGYPAIRIFSKTLATKSCRETAPCWWTWSRRGCPWCWSPRWHSGLIPSTPQTQQFSPQSFPCNRNMAVFEQLFLWIICYVCPNVWYCLLYVALQNCTGFWINFLKHLMKLKVVDVIIQNANTFLFAYNTFNSVADPLHFYTDLDPRIRLVENWSGSRSDLN